MLLSKARKLQIDDRVKVRASASFYTKPVFANVLEVYTDASNVLRIDVETVEGFFLGKLSHKDLI